ncbi:MAG: TetR/AcrR family transcriptional regulator [Alphaproteobacteria bacterium]|nr:TetR/AcrR family transcriptional regulator [Alphaproteobacteria bacterium]
MRGERDGTDDTDASGARQSIGARRNPASAAAILDAAEALLAEKGLGGFSIEAVARAARAGKPTIYRWWPSRTSLVLAVYQRSKQVLPEVDTGSVAGDCRAFLTSLLTYWRDTPSGQLFRSVVAEAQHNTEAAEVLAAYSDERHNGTANIFRRAMARGEIRADIDPVLAAEMLASFARGRLLTGRLDAPPAAIERVVDQFVGGLRA